jgi:hypothetical protein
LYLNKDADDVLSGGGLLPFICVPYVLLL